MANQNTNDSKSILDTDVPDINAPLLLPTKYIQEKTPPKFTKAYKLKKEISKLFDKFKKRPGRPEKLKEGWYGELKRSVFDLSVNRTRSVKRKRTTNRAPDQPASLLWFFQKRHLRVL